MKQCDLPNKQENDIALDLCKLRNEETPDQVIGAQLYKGIWSIYLRSQRARDHLIKTKFLKINNNKIVFKDLPMCLNN